MSVESCSRASCLYTVSAVQSSLASQIPTICSAHHQTIIVKARRSAAQRKLINRQQSQIPRQHDHSPQSKPLAMESLLQSATPSDSTVPRCKLGFVPVPLYASTVQLGEDIEEVAHGPATWPKVDDVLVEVLIFHEDPHHDVEGLAIRYHVHTAPRLVGLVHPRLASIPDGVTILLVFIEHRPPAVLLVVGLGIDSRGGRSPLTWDLSLDGSRLRFCCLLDRNTNAQAEM